MFLICLKEAGLGTSVSQVYSNPTREVGMILELLKGVMTGLQLPKVENDDNREGLIKASMLARKMHIKNVTHYINDYNYEFQPLLQLAFKRNLEHWAFVHFMLLAGFNFVSGLLWFTFPPCLWLCTSGAHLLCDPAHASYLLCMRLTSTSHACSGNRICFQKQHQLGRTDLKSSF